MNNQHIAIRLPNWLGDVIMTLPSLTALTSAGFSFELFGKSWIQDLFSAYPYPTHCIPNNYWEHRRLYQNTQANRAILFTNSISSTLPLCFTGITCYGYHTYIRQILRCRTLCKQAGGHEIEYFWHLAEFAAQTSLSPPQNPHLLIADLYQQQVDQILKTYHISTHFVVICPGAIGRGTKGQSKSWPHWQALCAELSRRGVHLVLCPAPFEVAQFTQDFGGYTTIVPNLNIPLYAALMQRAKQVIANDSGPLHLAAAVHAPVLGIFGQTDPQRTRPWGGDYIGKLGQWPSLKEVLDTLSLS